ncbi:hypothetical protein L6164_002269 [Bauhinia variegata]|uniref:Uncharacterized protein n=1 Tax=Bauhinia variegata TaxID=167791 RepID=A0ACB9PY76_BAUVA|nr:hypothetical protein L6164_002269 [Bauhinia variegata]
MGEAKQNPPLLCERVSSLPFFTAKRLVSCLSFQVKCFLALLFDNVREIRFLFLSFSVILPVFNISNFGKTTIQMAFV